MSDPLHVIIFEGPAGSGKSTAIQRGLQLKLYREPVMMVEVPRPRQYAPGAGTNLSQLKDYLRVLGAFVTHQSGGNKPIVFDRWAVSQYVYHLIREGKKVDPLIFAYGYMPQMFNNFVGAAAENLWRHNLQWNLPSEFDIFLDFYFIVPEESALAAARSRKGPGYYPYPIEQEIENYLEVMDAWEDLLGFDAWHHRQGLFYRAQRFPSYLPERKLDTALRQTAVLAYE